MGEGLSLNQDKSVGRVIFKRIWSRSWWTVVFTTLCIAFYFQAAHSRTTAIFDMSSRIHEMENDKMLSAQDREELCLRLQSESDPAWQELILMKELGVVPEGYTKIQFQK